MKRRRIEMTGRRFGKWTVLGPAERVRRTLFWRCRCDCGAEASVSGCVLRSGGSKSCVACGHTRAAAKVRTHGQKKTIAYATWIQINRRCHAPGAKDYGRYGAVGITVCDRWRHDFPAFLADMGPRPSVLHSIDRIDGTKGYEPGNCRWATTKEQSRNMRTNRRIAAFGESLIAADWAERTGLPESAIEQRIRSGWSHEDAVSRPLRVTSRTRRTS